MSDTYARALEIIEESILPYRVKLDTQGCKICGSNVAWCVVNADGAIIGKTWPNRDEAQWFAEMLKIAHEEGAAPQTVDAPRGELPARPELRKGDTQGVGDEDSFYFADEAEAYMDALEARLAAVTADNQRLQEMLDKATDFAEGGEE